tara:strand:+ start:1648 stop:2415 length:768 start_codon:yes stop_codon:yes gene_type:complete
MSYEKLLLSAREQGELRRQQKGLGRRERKFVDNEIDTALLTGEGIGKKSLIPSREKELDSELDFMTEFFNKLQASNMDLKSQVQGALEKANADSTQKEPKLNTSIENELKNQTAADFISKLEVSKPQKTYKAYWDEKRYSIGFGTKANSKDEVISHEEAVSRLNKATAKAQKDVVEFKEKFNYGWNEDQINALTSFTYNLGRENLLRLIESGRRGDEEISDMILEYNMSGGKVNPGLTKRRKAEYELFSAGSIAD